MGSINETQPPSPTDFELVCVRLQEFFAERTPWHRQLWNIGTVLSLREVLEYTEACLTGRSPNTAGLRFVIKNTRGEVSRDPGVAHLAVELNGVLQQLEVRSPRTLSRNDCDQLEQLVHRAQAEYFRQWANTTTTESVEFSSRAIASHLLDAGISNTQLYRWLQAKRPSLVSLSELAEETAAMTTEMLPEQFSVFIPCSAPYAELLQESEGSVRWLDSHTASIWLQEYIPVSKRRRQHGGFLVVVEQRDPWAAVDAARSLIARADARAKVARLYGEGIKVDGWARVADNPHDFDVRHPFSKVEIGSLDRQKAVYHFDGGLPTPIDDALELASYMESPSVGAAIIGGWSAIEALLVRSDETSKHLAADRCAALVTCSLPRAELTHLAYQHMHTADDQLATDIQSADTTYTKVWHAAEHLRSGKHLTLTDHKDIAAQNRIVAILENPTEHLKRIRGYMTTSLRRLYNQRNLIAHSGSLRSAALTATARTSFGLVGAGLDRIVHVQLRTNDKLSPPQLIARAETELNMVGTPGGRSPIFLLDQPLKHDK